jgi:hypothetical protein
MPPEEIDSLADDVKPLVLELLRHRRTGRRSNLAQPVRPPDEAMWRRRDAAGLAAAVARWREPTRWRCCRRRTMRWTDPVRHYRSHRFQAACRLAGPRRRSSERRPTPPRSPSCRPARLRWQCCHRRTGRRSNLAQPVRPPDEAMWRAATPLDWRPRLHGGESQRGTPAARLAANAEAASARRRGTIGMTAEVLLTVEEPMPTI